MTYKKSEITSMNDEALYRLAKHTLNIPGCGTMGTVEMRAHVLAALVKQANLIEDEAPAQPAVAKAAAVSKKVSGGVLVSYPPYGEEYPQLIGKTLAEARQSLGAVWSIEPTARAYVNGKIVSDLNSVRLADGDRVEFVKSAAEKG